MSSTARSDLKFRSWNSLISKLNYNNEGDIEKIPFRKNYRSAGCCSRFCFSYASNLLYSINEADATMKEDMIEDMTESDKETIKLLNIFQ